MAGLLIAKGAAISPADRSPSREQPLDDGEPGRIGEGAEDGRQGNMIHGDPIAI